MVSKIFHPKSAPGCGPSGRLHYGHIRDGESVIDEVIVRLTRHDGGTEVVEINCHGGVAAAAQAMGLLVGAGAVKLPPRRFAARAAADSGLDGIRAEAARLLPLAETKLAVRVLCDQINGALSAAIRAVDTESPWAAEKLGSLVESAWFGRALAQPRRLALVGKPNVGKSTLFNALVGHNRTIVSPVPGTTRDFINEFVALGGYPVELMDTAGLRRRGGVVEMKGVEATWRVASDADLIVIVLDGSAPDAPDEHAVLRSLLQKNPVLAVNKSDLPARLDLSGFPPGADLCKVSALTGRGLREIELAVLRRFPSPAQYPPASPVVFTAEQARILSDAQDLCRSGRADAAREKLARLAG